MNDTQNTMDIKIVEFIEGAKQSEGITVIIDVFRAFSVECCKLGDLQNGSSFYRKNEERAS